MSFDTAKKLDKIPSEKEGEEKKTSCEGTHYFGSEQGFAAAEPHDSRERGRRHTKRRAVLYRKGRRRDC